MAVTPGGKRDRQMDGSWVDNRGMSAAELRIEHSLDERPTEPGAESEE